MPFLNDEQRAKLKAQHRLERDKRTCDRIKAVILYDKGWSIPQIAEALLLSEGTIRNHVEDFKREQKLRPNGGGSIERLSKRQAQDLEQHLREHTYLYVKDILRYVTTRWGIHFTISGLRSWLRRHNFSYKKPTLVPGKADSVKQAEWVEEYEQLKASLQEKETICFIDGVHPTHNVQPAFGWIKKGVRQTIPSNTGRARINLTGAIDILSHKIHIRRDSTLNADATIAFFKQLEQAYPIGSKIHVFCDNARYYRNKKVQDHLKNSNVELHFLPPYSPNLNPIERLWKWMKETVVYNTYYEAVESFEAAIFGIFRSLQNLGANSELGQCLRRRVRDRFRIADPATLI